MDVVKGLLNSFNSGNYTATIQVSGSDKVYLSSVTVSRSIPSGEMIPGRNLVIVFFDDFNSKEAVVTGVYTQ
ncbi:MAG: hypothetical protein JSU79_01290 [Dehalococcoidales bacterium]|nr:MAG: hypothetical protein JSU79_01290 [Dehalococcoidales bacterium]